MKSFSRDKNKTKINLITTIKAECSKNAVNLHPIRKRVNQDNKSEDPLSEVYQKAIKKCRISYNSEDGNHLAPIFELI